MPAATGLSIKYPVKCNTRSRYNKYKRLIIADHKRSITTGHKPGNIPLWRDFNSIAKGFQMHCEGMTIT